MITSLCMRINSFKLKVNIKISYFSNHVISLKKLAVNQQNEQKN